jgi:hypothetical protein
VAPVVNLKEWLPSHAVSCKKADALLADLEEIKKRKK